jgi:hypothetical protein
MSNKILNDEWLFKEHSKEQISHWVSTLKYGYFWRRPSFRDNEDYIDLTLNFDSFDDLCDILKKIGIELKKIPPGAPIPTPDPFTWEEYKQWKHPIKDFPEYEQTFYLLPNGNRSPVWIENKTISFSFGGQEQAWYVGDKDFQNCLHLEALIEKTGLAKKVNRDLEENIGTITKEKYPSLFST